MTLYVYIVRDAADGVLYVGQSIDPESRVRQHRATPWGSQIARVEVLEVADHVEADREERRLIAALSPLHNTTRYVTRLGSSRQVLPEPAASELRDMLCAARVSGDRSPEDERLSNYIALLRVNGWTLAAIGEPINFTREAVRLRANRGELRGRLPLAPLPPRKPEPLPKVRRRLEIRSDIAEQMRSLYATAKLCRGATDDTDPRRVASIELTNICASLVAQGVAVNQVARVLGVSHLAVKLRLARHGYTDAPPSQPQTPFGTKPPSRLPAGCCMRGHDLTGANLRITQPGGVRVCRLCERERCAKYRERRRTAAA